VSFVFWACALALQSGGVWPPSSTCEQYRVLVPLSKYCILTASFRAALWGVADSSPPNRANGCCKGAVCESP
jgi:hypothetical protein